MSKELSTWLSKELERRRLSYRALSKQAGVSHAQISRVVTGESKPGAEFCIKIAHALGESPEKLLRLAGLLPPAVDTPDDPVIAELVEITRRLSAEDRREVLKFATFRYLQDQSEKN